MWYHFAMEETKEIAVENEQPYVMSKTLRRVLASVFDMAVMLLTLVICLIPALVATVIYFNDARAGNIPFLIIFYFLGGAVFAALYFAYHIAIPSFFHGQTWGQKMFGIGYKKRKGGDPDTTCYLIRSISSLLLFMLTIGASPIIDWIVLGLGKTKRSFLDVVSDMSVVDYEELIF